MALFDKKFANFFGLLEEEEYEEEAEYEQGITQQAVNSASVEFPRAVNENEPRRETRFSDNIERAVKDSQQIQGKRAQQMQQDASKVVAMSNGPRSNTGSGNSSKKVNAKNSGKITIVEPRTYSEAMSIAKKIIAGESVLVNFYLIDESQARRIVDFLTGTVYAQDGDIKRVGDEIFLCTPSEIEIDISVAQSLSETTFFD